VDKCLVREHGRAVRGVKVEDTRRGRKFQRTNVISARFRNEDNKIKHVSTLCYTQNTDSEFFVEWFRKNLVKSLRKGVTVILDNASFHPKKKLRNLARRHGLKLLFLPAYSPDYNPIEKDWANMKTALIDELRNDDVELDKAIYQYFIDY
jgi:transposase